MSYEYAQVGNIEPGTGRFMPTPGSGSWEVIVVDFPAAHWPEAIGEGFLKFLKRRG
jgi:hypothetical protein